MSADASIFSNPDQALIHRFAIAAQQAPAPVDTNPYAKALGTELLQADLERGRVVLAFSPDPLFIQGTGVLQGGAVMGMLDFAMAFAALARLAPGRSCATVGMTSSFLRPAPQGRYIAEGDVQRAGAKLAFTEARLLRADDRVVVATASSTLAVI